MELNCAFTIAAPSVSWPENCAALSAAPTRKTPWNAVRSAGGLSAIARGRWAQPIASAPKKTGSARQPLPVLDDIQGGAANVLGVAARHDVEPPRLDYALHVGAVVGQMLRPDLEGDGAGFPRLQRDAPEPAQLLHRLRRRADDVPDVELRHLVSCPSSRVRHVDRDGGPPLGADASRRHAQVRIRESRVRQAVPEGEQRLRRVEQVPAPGGGLVVVEHW